MKQLMLIEPKKLEWREVDDLQLQGPAEALVEPVVVASCDIDPALIAGLFSAEEPFAFGHEGVARVVDIGDGVESVRPGDLVAVPFQITCGECPDCSRGATASCSGVKPRRAMYGMAPLARKEWGGFFSDRVRVPYAEAMLVPLPDGSDPVSVASISDNLPDAWRAVGPHLKSFPEARVLVVAGGTPSIGLYAVAIARALHADVTYVDSDEDRADIARSLGAEVIDQAYPRRVEPHQVTVDASASVEGLHCALRSTAGDGVCTCVATLSPEATLPLLEMYTRNITFIIGRTNARTGMDSVLELITQGSLASEVVTTQVVTWDEAIDAYMEPFTKVVFTRD